MQSQKELAFTDDEIYTTQTQEKPSGLVDVDSRPQKDIVLVELLIIPENTFHSEILQRTRVTLVTKQFQVYQTGKYAEFHCIASDG